MNDLWSDWYQYHMYDGAGGYKRAPFVNGEVSSVLQDIDNAAYVAFMPMMTELRGTTLSDGVYVPIFDLGQMFGDNVRLDYDTNLKWSYQDRWLKQCQEAWYACTCLSGSNDYLQDALLQNIQIWKGIAPSGDTNCPMNEQWLPQARMLSSMFTDLSSLEGTKQHPWWTDSTYGSGAYDWKRYTQFVGPYMPSNMNWKWYCAMWRALAKLANTPTIQIGKGATDWRWLNPLRQPTSGYMFSIGDILYNYQSRFSWWSEIDSTFVSDLDEAICGFSSPELWKMPWSVCGCPIGRALYTGDASGRMQSAYQNLPILEPLDGMRAFFGDPMPFADAYSGRGDIRYKYGDPIFDESYISYYLPSDLSNALSVGCDFGFPNNYWLPYSFVQKAGRDSSGDLETWKLDSDKPDYLCKPPLRLGAQNFLAHQWLWESFLDGKDSEGYYHTNLQYAWTPFIFNRMHYYRHYEFYVGGEAHLSTDGDGWQMVVNQGVLTDSWSNYTWRPVSELAPHEPVIANVGPNTLKWWNNASYGSNVPTSPWPLGWTGISCEFAIPLPLSVDSNGVVVLNTTWLSSSGYTRQEWRELVRITQTLFPRTRDDKIEEQLQYLYYQYLDEGTGSIPNAQRNLSSWEDQLSSYEKSLADVSADTWNTVWWTVVDRVWPSDKEFNFNEGISATSAWTGTDPGPFDNYLSDWYGTYWYQNGYYNFPVQKVNGDFDDGYPNYASWRENLGWVFTSMSSDIANSQVWKDGELQGDYYSSYQLYLMQSAMSSVQYGLSTSGSSALAAAGIDIQSIGTQWPPVRCDITTDPQTGIETSSYTMDENRWKSAVMQINWELESQAERWYDESKHSLGNAFLEYYYYTELSDKMQYISEVSSVLDSTILAEWQNEYGIALPYEEQYWLDQIAYAQWQIDNLCADIERLSAEYDEEYQRIMDETFDDPLPSKEDLEKLLHYQLDPHINSLSTQWSAALNLLAIAPDTWEEQLSAYPHGYDKYEEQYYYCEQPKTRWPAHQWPTWYMVPAKKTSLEEITVSGETQLSNIERGMMFGGYYSGYTQKPFDEFRREIDNMAERDEPYQYFGQERPRPSQLYGSDVVNPGRWNLSAVVSVDIGDLSEGIFDIQDARNLAYYNTLSVSFIGNTVAMPTYQAYALYIWCSNGPLVHTIDCQQGVQRWTQQSTVGWKLAEGESEKVEYYAKEPVAGEDYDLPELSGHLQIEFGRQVLGALDMQTVYSTM